MDAFRNFFSGKTGLIVAFVILMLLFILVIVYIISQMRNNAYKKGKPLTSKVINLNERSEQIEVPGSDLPNQTMGEQYTLSFWLYLKDVPQTDGFHKMLLYRGEKDNIQTANPLVFMDHRTNTLYFALQPRNESLANVSGVNYQNLFDITEKNYFLNANLKYADATTNRYIIVPVNNVILNRWVHFALAVKDNLITVFVNGGESENSKGYDKGNILTSTVEDIYMSRTPTLDDTIRPKDPPILQNTLKGSIFIGRSESVGGGYGVDGYLSRLGFYNYALNADDVKRVYRQGAIPNNPLFSAFGVNKYGVRSPFYRLASVS
jgi:hypothetical protein